MESDSSPNKNCSDRSRLVVKFSKLVRESKTELVHQCELVQNQLPGGNLVRPPTRSGRAVFDVESSANLSELAEKISQLDGIEYAEPDSLDSSA